MEIIQREKFCGKKLKNLNDVCSHAFNSIIESNIHILMRNDNSRIDLSIFFQVFIQIDVMKFIQLSVESKHFSNFMPLSDYIQNNLHRFQY